jgi:glycosyltransferase involved in cell wall biosynthesis
MRIAIFDYKVIPTNPIGGCHRRMIEGLFTEHEFVVFAPQFDNPAPDQICHLRVPVPLRPLALLFLSFHLLTPLWYALHRLWRRQQRFDLIQSVESNTLLGQAIYSHFCHRRYLRQHWHHVRPAGVRGLLGYLDHRLHALLEPVVYRKARHVVVPSRGLARELEAEYPATMGKITVIPNPVDLNKMTRPEDFDSATIRQTYGFAANDTLLVFTALGHFERKGLPLILEAMANLPEKSVKLLVVGGAGDLIESYRANADACGLADRVHFAGMQKDVRPYLWSADAFIFPSIYETFSLSIVEAMAAGLPTIAPLINGVVEESARDGENIILIPRSVEGVRNGIARLLAMDSKQRREISEEARLTAQEYSVESFQQKWRELYCRLLYEPLPRRG